MLYKGHIARYLLTLADDTVGLGWVGISTFHATYHGQHVFERHCIQRMRSTDFLIIATPLSCARQQHPLGLCVLL